MNICLVCRAFPPESGISGTGTYMHSIAKCLERLGHTIVVISYSQLGETKSKEGALPFIVSAQKSSRAAGYLGNGSRFGCSAIPLQSGKRWYNSIAYIISISFKFRSGEEKVFFIPKFFLSVCRKSTRTIIFKSCVRKKSKIKDLEILWRLDGKICC